jgi:monovalent cation/proton antiporter MnhG/PhaG subunit
MLQSFGLVIIFFGLIASIFSIFATFFKIDDFYAKQHGSGLNDSFAIPLIIIGSGIFSLNLLFFFKSVFVIFFFVITSATSCHCISSIYYRENLKDKKTHNLI